MIIWIQILAMGEERLEHGSKKKTDRVRNK